jgi:hypothetical protein
MAAYASLAEVKARAGAVARAFSQDTTPGDAEIETFLDNVADEINGYLIVRGASLPVTDANAQRALVGVNADGALLLALDGRFPAGTGPAAVVELRRAVQARYDAALAAIQSGTHVAILIIEGEVSLDELAATAFWIEEPDYGMYLTPEELAALNPYFQPEFAKGMKF